MIDLIHAEALNGSEETRNLGRDTGPASARNTSRGSLIREAHAVFREMGKGATLPEVRSACLYGGLIRQPAHASREKIWNGLYWRYFMWKPPKWVLADLAEAARGEPTDPHFIGLLYVHYARRDRLAYDFVTESLWTRWNTRQLKVKPNDVLDFLANHPIHSEPAARWTDTGRRKLVRNTLSSLRDFGLLHGSRRKMLQRPVVAPEVALHLVHLLYGERLRGRSLLEATDWRLFLWDMEDAVRALGQLAQRGALRFERSGRTVILEIPDPPGEMT